MNKKKPSIPVSKKTKISKKKHTSKNEKIKRELYKELNQKIKELLENEPIEEAKKRVKKLKDDITKEIKKRQKAREELKIQALTYSQQEEAFNAVTHAIGMGLSIAGLIFIVTMAAIYGDSWRVVSFSIYGFSLLILYTASTIYHAVHNQELKKKLQILDHASIYILIAGTYTPFCLVPLNGVVGWSFFGIIWGLAIFGIILKIFFTNRFMIISTIAYVLMGWLILGGIKPLYASISGLGLMWLLIGGLSYTLGIIPFTMKFKYSHGIWHLFVLAGSIAHYLAIFFYVLPVK